MDFTRLHKWQYWLMFSPSVLLGILYVLLSAFFRTYAPQKPPVSDWVIETLSHNLQPQDDSWQRLQPTTFYETKPLPKNMAKPLVK